MSYLTGSVITINEYNDFTNRVNEVVNDLHRGEIVESTASFGYGQGSTLPTVSTGNLVKAADWDALVKLIERAAAFQGTVIGPLPTSINVSDTIGVISTLDAAITAITVNKLNITSANLPLVQQLSSSRITRWAGFVEYDINVTFSNWDEMRYFFNSGGKIVFRGVKQGTNITSHDTYWQNLLNQVGDVTFNYSNTFKSGSLGNDTTNGFYDLNGSFPLTIFDATISGNVYKIEAVLNSSPGIASGINFKLTYTTPGVVNGTIVATILEAHSNNTNITINPGKFVETYALEDKIITGTSVDASTVPSIIDERTFDVTSNITLGDTSIMDLSNTSVYEPEALILSGTRFNTYVLNTDGFEYLTGSDSFVTISLKRDPNNRASTSRVMSITTKDISSSDFTQDVLYSFVYEIDSKTGINTEEKIDFVIRDSMPNWKLGILLDKNVLSPSSSYDLFGYCVDINKDGTTAIIGAPGRNLYRGSVYVYERTGSKWNFKQEVFGSESTSGTGATPENDGTWFGHSVSYASDADIFAVGTIKESSTAGSGIHSGSVYIFEKDSITGTWSQQNRITPSNIEDGGNFGFSVAINHDGTEIIVGAPLEDYASGNIITKSAGACYIFQKSSGVWVERHRFIHESADTVVDERMLGYSVSIIDTADGSFAYAGKPGALINSEPIGKVEVYKKSNPTTWSLIQDIPAPNPNADGMFGVSVDSSKYNGTLVIGSSMSKNTYVEEGLVYVYVYDKTNNLYSLKQTLSSGIPASGINFGKFVSVGHDGRTIAIGSPAPSSLPQNVSSNKAIAKPSTENGYSSSLTSLEKLMPAGVDFGESGGMLSLVSAATVFNTVTGPSITPSKIFGKYMLGYQLTTYKNPPAPYTTSDVFLEVYLEGLHSPDLITELKAVYNDNSPITVILTKNDIVDYRQQKKPMSFVEYKGTGTSQTQTTVTVSDSTRWMFALSTGAGILPSGSTIPTEFTFTIDEVVAINSSYSALSSAKDEPKIITQATISAAVSGESSGFSNTTANGTFGYISTPNNSALSKLDYLYSYFTFDQNTNTTTFNFSISNVGKLTTSVSYITLEGDFDVTPQSTGFPSTASLCLTIPYNALSSVLSFKMSKNYKMKDGKTYYLKLWDKNPSSSHYGTSLTTTTSTTSTSSSSTILMNANHNTASNILEHTSSSSISIPMPNTVTEFTAVSNIHFWTQDLHYPGSASLLGSPYYISVDVFDGAGNTSVFKLSRFRFTITDVAIGKVVLDTLNTTGGVSFVNVTGNGYTAHMGSMPLLESSWTTNSIYDSVANKQKNFKITIYDLATGSTSSTVTTVTLSDTYFKNNKISALSLSSNPTNGSSITFTGTRAPISDSDIHDISLTYPSYSGLEDVKEIITNPVISYIDTTPTGSTGIKSYTSVVSFFDSGQIRGSNVQIGFNEAVQRYKDVLFSSDTSTTIAGMVGFSGYKLPTPTTTTTTNVMYKKNIVSTIAHGADSGNATTSRWVIDIAANIPQAEISKIFISGIFTVYAIPFGSTGSVSSQITVPGTWELDKNYARFLSNAVSGGVMLFNVPVKYTQWDSASGVTRFEWATTSANGASSVFPLVKSGDYGITFVTYDDNKFGLASHCLDSKGYHLPINRDATTNASSYWKEDHSLTGKSTANCNGGEISYTDTFVESDLVKVRRIGNYKTTDGTNLVRWYVDIERPPASYISGVEYDWLKSLDITGFFETSLPLPTGSTKTPVSSTKRRLRFVPLVMGAYPYSYETAKANLNTSYKDAEAASSYTVYEDIFDTSGNVVTSSSRVVNFTNTTIVQRMYVYMTGGTAATATSHPSANVTVYPMEADTIRYVFQYSASVNGTASNTIDEYDRVSPGQNYDVTLNGKGVAASTNTGTGTTNDTLVLQSSPGVGFVEVFHKDTAAIESNELWVKQQTLQTSTGDSGKLFGTCSISQGNDDIVVGSSAFAPQGGNYNGKVYFYGFANVAAPSVVIAGDTSVSENIRDSIDNFATGTITVTQGDNAISYEEVLINGVTYPINSGSNLIETSLGVLSIDKTTVRKWRFTPTFNIDNFDSVTQTKKPVPFKFNYNAVDVNNIKTSVLYKINIIDGQVPSTSIMSSQTSFNRILNGLLKSSEGSDTLSSEKFYQDNALVNLYGKNAVYKEVLPIGYGDFSGIIPKGSTNTTHTLLATTFAISGSADTTLDRVGYGDATAMNVTFSKPSGVQVAGSLTPPTSVLGYGIMEISSTTTFVGESGHTVYNVKLEGHVIENFVQDIYITGKFNQNGTVDTTDKTVILDSANLVRFTRGNTGSKDFTQLSYSLKTRKDELVSGNTYYINILSNNIYKNLLAGSYSNVNNNSALNATGYRNVNISTDHVRQLDGFLLNNKASSKNIDVYMIPTTVSATEKYVTVYLRWAGSHSEKDITRLLLSGWFGYGTNVNSLTKRTNMETLTLTAKQEIASQAFSSAGYSFTPFNTSGNQYTQWSWKSTNLSSQYNYLFIPGEFYSVSLETSSNDIVMVAGNYGTYTGYYDYTAPYAVAPPTTFTAGTVSNTRFNGRKFSVYTNLSSVNQSGYYAIMLLTFEGAVAYNYITSMIVEGVFQPATGGTPTYKKFTLDVGTGTSPNYGLGDKPRDGIPRIINFSTTANSSTWLWDMRTVGDGSPGFKEDQFIPGNSYIIKFVQPSSTTTTSIYTVTAGDNYAYSSLGNVSGVHSFSTVNKGGFSLISGPDLSLSEFSVSSNDQSGNTYFNKIASSSSSAVIKNFNIKGKFIKDGYVFTENKTFSVTNQNLTNSPSAIQFSNQKFGNGWIDPATKNSWMMIPGEKYDLYVNDNSVPVENLSPDSQYRVFSISTDNSLNTSTTSLRYTIEQADKDSSTSMRGELIDNCGKNVVIKDVYTLPTGYASGAINYYAVFTGLPSHGADYVFSFDARTHADFSRGSYGQTLYGFKGDGVTSLTFGPLPRNPSGEWMAYFFQTLTLTEADVLVDGSTQHPNLKFFCTGPGHSIPLRAPSTFTATGLPNYAAQFTVTFDWNYPNYANGGRIAYVTGNTIKGYKAFGSTTAIIDFNDANTNYDTRYAHDVNVTNAILRFDPIVTCPSSPTSELFTILPQVISNSGGVVKYGFNLLSNMGDIVTGAITSSQRYLTHGNNPVLTHASVITTNNTTQKVEVRLQGDYRSQPTFVKRIVIQDNYANAQAFDVTNLTVTYDSNADETTFSSAISPIYAPFGTYSNSMAVTFGMTLYYG